MNKCKKGFVLGFNFFVRNVLPRYISLSSTHRKKFQNVYFTATRDSICLEYKLCALALYSVMRVWLEG